MHFAQFAIIAAVVAGIGITPLMWKGIIAFVIYVGKAEYSNSPEPGVKWSWEVFYAWQRGTIGTMLNERTHQEANPTMLYPSTPAAVPAAPASTTTR
ncbi:MAG TPA: hypothetical protein VGG42_09900 [Acidobacteriaceae bacterium]|jgi:hypothetical protein